MKYLVLLLVGAFVFALPQSASAAQCTTGDLDLICAEGQVLRGIANSGQKICEPSLDFAGLDLVCADGQFLRGISSGGENYVVTSALVVEVHLLRRLIGLRLQLILETFGIA